MSIKEKYEVKNISFKELKPWLLKKHYAESIPPVSYKYGLFLDEGIVGVCSFGKSYAREEGESWEDFPVRELNRLVTKDGLEKNTLSYFVSQCLKSLPSPMIIISYADPNHGHHGYIYQATNWIYTGKSSSEKVYLDKRTNKKLHRRTLYDKFGTSSIKKLPNYIVPLGKTEGKHRYYYFIGNKRKKRKMKKMLRF
ncbi:MAG: hypothetical protein ACOCP4_06580, partial [Candidatus Woesearchaeota archaeon]